MLHPRNLLAFVNYFAETVVGEGLEVPPGPDGGPAPGLVDLVRERRPAAAKAPARTHRVVK